MGDLEHILRRINFTYSLKPFHLLSKVVLVPAIFLFTLCLRRLIFFSSTAGAQNAASFLSPSCLQLLEEWMLFNLYIVRTASPPGFTVATMAASGFPTTISTISICPRILTFVQRRFFQSTTARLTHFRYPTTVSPSRLLF